MLEFCLRTPPHTLHNPTSTTPPPPRAVKSPTRLAQLPQLRCVSGRVPAEAIAAVQRRYLEQQRARLGRQLQLWRAQRRGEAGLRDIAFPRQRAYGADVRREQPGAVKRRRRLVGAVSIPGAIIGFGGGQRQRQAFSHTHTYYSSRAVFTRFPALLLLNQSPPSV